MNDVTQIFNFRAFSERLATAGMPTREQLGWLAGAGFERVINLAVNDSPEVITDEGELVVAQGLEYIHIPVVWENPRLIDLQRFMDVMDASQDKKVFVHCVMNMRVSAFMFLYRVIRLKEPVAAATEAMTEIWTPYGVWQEFLQTALEYYQVRY